MRHPFDTRIHLVQELEKLPPTPSIQTIIEEAKAGEFHDYKNKKYTCGKMALNALLTEAGLYDLAKRVREGEFDESPDEEDKAELRKTLPESQWGLFGL